MTSLVDFVTTHSLAELKQEGEKWNQILIERRQAATLAAEAYNQASTTVRLIDFAIKMREAGEPSQNGYHQPEAVESPSASFSPSASVSPENEEDGETDKTALMRATLREVRLTPAELYRTLLEQGIAVHRAYVYTVLQRLKKRGQVDSDESGRYFAI